MKHPNFIGSGYYGYPAEPQNENERFESITGMNSILLDNAGMKYTLTSQGVVLSLDSAGGTVDGALYLSERIRTIKARIDALNLFIRCLNDYYISMAVWLSRHKN